MTPPTNRFEEGLKAFADFAVGGPDVARHRGRWAAFFRDRVGPSFGGRVVLEIGCADASFLATVAARHPAIGFIGLDWKFKSLHAGATTVATAGLRNVALLRGRAADLPRMFAATEVDEVWVFHPEPCAEPAQRANRLFAEPFLTDVHALLRDGCDSLLAVKTDHTGYYQWMLGLTGTVEPPAFRVALDAAAAGLAPNRTDLRVRKRDLLRPDDAPPPADAVRARLAVPITSPDFWRDPAAIAHTAGRAFAGVRTPFEARFTAKRRPIYYVEMRKRLCQS